MSEAGTAMKKKQRSFWVVAGAGGPARARRGLLLLTGTRPILGLDLEGGVSVILSAPEGTPDSDEPGPGEHPEPDRRASGRRSRLLFVTGNTIEVQIPGLRAARSRSARRSSSASRTIRGPRTPAPARRDAADAELASATVQPVVSSVCLTDDPTNEQAPTLFDEPAPVRGHRRRTRPRRWTRSPSRNSRDSSVSQNTGLATAPVLSGRRPRPRRLRARSRR